MFSSIKLYLYSAIAGVGLLLVGWIKILSKQKQDALQEAEIQKQNVVILEIQKEQSKELNNGLANAKKQADEVAHENNERASSRTKPTGKFGDKRLRNNNN